MNILVHLRKSADEAHTPVRAKLGSLHVSAALREANLIGVHGTPFYSVYTRFRLLLSVIGVLAMFPEEVFVK